MAENAEKSMSLSDFARKHHVSRKTATRWRAAGLVVPSVGPVDVEKSEKRLAERPAQNRGGFAKGPHAPDDVPAHTGTALADAKRVRFTFEALLAEHRAERLVESLAPIDAAVGVVADALADVKSRLRQAPAWVAPKLVKADTAPIAAATLSKTFCGALYDISKADNEPVWDHNLGDAPIDYAHARISFVDADGVVHHVPAYDDEPRPQSDLQSKPKRRRRSTQQIEDAIKEAGAEEEVTQELLTKVERAIPTMTLTEARTRREVAEGCLKRAQYDLMKRKVVRIDNVHNALTKNLNGVRSNLLAIASKTAPRCALLSDAAEIQKVISNELEMVLADVAEPKILIDGCTND
jgi:hypothetical protein